MIFWENPLQAWALALLIILGAWGGLLLLKQVILHNLRVIAQRTPYGWDDMLVELLGGLSRWLLLVVAVQVGSRYLYLSATAHIWIGVGVIGTLWMQVGLWGNVLIGHWIQRQINKEVQSGNGSSATAYGAFGVIGRVVLWGVVTLLVLENIPGVEVTSLVAGLGIGGLAVGLALQNILSDLFASFTIALDKPFVIGDFIVSGEYAGTVEAVGLKSTRLRSLSGEQVVFANTDLLSSRIRNYKRMLRRRVAFEVGVSYETALEHLERIPAIIQEIVAQQEAASFDRAHLKSLGNFALVYEIVYYVHSSDYAAYMDVQQAINLALLRRFAEMGIELAYPTQTLWLKNSPAG
ncbi:MAG: mechanosensitive ion channel family protein [Anaerolineales bacterium]